MKIKAVIMAGGSGTRLWPLSRKLYPKQFIKLFDNTSLLQNTLLRNKMLGSLDIIVGEDHRFIAAEQIREAGIKAELIIEPAAKNTASCAILAALKAEAEGCDTVILLPADHYIEPKEAYLKTIELACTSLDKYGICTIGIKPNFPSTGYGYIKATLSSEESVYSAEKFIEKPVLSVAQGYLEDGNYFWNSGIFIYKTKFMLEKARALQPNMLLHVKESLSAANKDLDFIRLSKESFEKIDSISVDYAIAEHLSSMALVEAQFTWNDLGTWESLWNVREKDADNNYLSSNVVAQKTSNSYIYSDKKLTATIGLDNVIVINTDDALLVADMSKSDEVKQVVEKLIERQKIEATEHTQTFRPWGWYQTIDNGDLHKVKRIVVHPGQKLSNQYHNHRAEHWVIVKGVAQVEIGDQVKQLHENDSIYIAKSMRHRLTNIGELDLHLIEVQTGEYLGEDDIVRISDIYGRN